MNRLRGPYSTAPSKASPQTLCQKCLKRGHYSYECKSSAQERPYASRPSRTQQLSNPKLQPKLNSDVPNDLLRKKGVADEELAKKEAERGRKRKLEEDGYANGSRKRSRSVSSYSSVSTISTNKSRSLSPHLGGRGNTDQSQSMSGLEVTGKRRRSTSSAMSYTSDPEYARNDQNGSKHRSARRLSPTPVGRRDSEALRERNGNQRRSPIRRRRSRSLSYTSISSYERTRKKHSLSRDGGKRRRRASKSPDDRGRERDFGGRRNSRRTYSPDGSRDRSEVTRHRKSMTPGIPQKASGALRSNHVSNPSFGRRSSYENDHDRYGGSTRARDESFKPNRAPLPQRKERSLSPFSKRLALTQAMNRG